MEPTHRLNELVMRLSPDQYARLLLFAESLAASRNSESARTFPQPLRERLRELALLSEKESLSEAERAEYVALAEQLENADAERIVV